MKKIEKSKINSKWDRINTIYEILSCSNEGISMAQLAKELDVSTKTIQRDLYEELSKYGAVKNGRLWKIDKKLISDSLKPNDRIVLGILDEMAKSAGNIFYGKVHSILTQISQQLEHQIFANFDSESLEDYHIELFSILENSIKEKFEIEFEYKKYNFKVKPLKLVYFNGFWYLLAFDTKNSDKFKKFHLKSISNIKKTDENFLVDSNIEERLKKANSIWFDLDKELFDVHLHIDEKIVKYFKRKPLKSQSILGKDSDGSIELVVSVTNIMEILPMVLLYMPYIRVLSPDVFAEKIKKLVKGYLDSL